MGSSFEVVSRTKLQKLAGNVLHRISEKSTEEGDYGCTLEELRTLMEARGAEAVIKVFDVISSSYHFRDKISAANYSIQCFLFLISS